MRRAQTSIEMGIILSFLLIIAMGVIWTTVGSSGLATTYKTSANADAIASRIAISISNVYIAGIGAKQTITIPSSIGSITDFEIAIDPNTIVVRQGNRTLASATTMGNVTQTILLPGNTYTLSNIKGEVQLA